MSFIQITVPLADHDPVTLPGQQVTRHFALTPTIGVTDGELVLAHGLDLRHIPTGHTITGDPYTDLTSFAAALEQLPIDWAGLTATTCTPEQAALIRDTWKTVWDTDEHDKRPWPKWIGDKATPAVSLLAARLDDLLTEPAREHRITEITTRATRLDTELGDDLGITLRWMSGRAYSAGYGLIYTLAVLHSANPALADHAARQLVSAWEAGEVMAEHAVDWRDQITKNLPLNLYGVPAFGDFATAAHDATRPGAGSQSTTPYTPAALAAAGAGTGS